MKGFVRDTNDNWVPKPYTIRRETKKHKWGKKLQQGNKGNHRGNNASVKGGGG